jgi:hypothetical protein
VIAAESRQKLDDGILPDLAAWDIRRYGGTQIALRYLASGESSESEGGPLAAGEEVIDADR